jgi:hypothetical protein
LKNTARADKASLIEGPILEKIAMQQRESLLLAELSHVSLLPNTCGFQICETKRIPSQISLPPRGSFGLTIQCGSKMSTNSKTPF